MEAPTCPPDAELAAFVERKLAEAAADVVRDHLDTCAICRTSLLALAEARQGGEQGKTVLGTFEIRERLGAGGMGVVYAARDLTLDRDVAIKVLTADGESSEQRLLCEARTLAKIRHPAVLTVYQAGIAEGVVYIAMERIVGTTLQAYLATPRPVTEILALFRRAGHGLAAAHAEGVVHRDFKPANVLLELSADRVTRVLVADFGLAAAAAETAAASGTRGYIAPEQRAGAPADVRADVFSFASSLQEALVGRARPRRIDRLIAAALATDPAARPSLAALLAALAPPNRRAWIAGLAVAVVALGVAGVVATRTPGTSAPSAEPLFATSMGTTLALSADGKRLALGSDRLEVRSVDGVSLWTIAVAKGETITHVELEGGAVRFGVQQRERLGDITDQVRRWNYEGDNSIAIERDVQGRWLGSTAAGDLLWRWPSNRNELLVVDHQRQVRRWPIDQPISHITISPNRRRIAYLRSGRFDGTIVVRDLDGDRVIESPALATPTALTWRDDMTLVYATGVQDAPAIHRVSVTDQMSPPTKVFALESGWIGQLVASGTTMYFTDLHPTSSVRTVERTDARTSVRELDPTVRVALGWIGPDEFLTWSRTTQLVERRGSVRAMTAIELDAEPINATVAGDVLIAALRRADGREVVAHSLASGRMLWSHRDRRTLAVRCAADRHPPCFAIRLTAGKPGEVVTVDPSTGALGTTAIAVGDFEDLAIDDDATHMLLASAGSVSDLELASRHSTVLEGLRMHSVRSVSFDPKGGVLIAGNMSVGDYQAGTLRDGTWSMVAQADYGPLSLLRPSADGSRVLVLARAYAPQLWRLSSGTASRARP